SLSAGYPVQIQIKVSDTTYLPYTSAGHYVVVKDIIYDKLEGRYCVIINDPHPTKSRVYRFPLSVLLDYNKQHSGGVSIHKAGI
ncbi:MAG: hypothetical protein FWF08_05770, partial [Oscillospiraceae bacterium]|nr:hypothetical protein [Oscillospiraceae bacterium]